jgi:curved DNA-binding protein
VKVRVKVPTRLSAKERESLEALRTADEREYRKDVESYGA